MGYKDANGATVATPPQCVVKVKSSCYGATIAKTTSGYGLTPFSSPTGATQTITCQPLYMGSGTATCPSVDSTTTVQNAYTYDPAPIVCSKDKTKCYGDAVPNSKPGEGLQAYANSAGGTQLITCEPGVPGGATATCQAQVGALQALYQYVDGEGTASSTAPTCDPVVTRCYGAAIDNAVADKGMTAFYLDEAPATGAAATQEIMCGPLYYGGGTATCNIKAGQQNTFEYTDAKGAATANGGLDAVKCEIKLLNKCYGALIANSKFLGGKFDAGEHSIECDSTHFGGGTAECPVAVVGTQSEFVYKNANGATVATPPQCEAKVKSSCYGAKISFTTAGEGLTPFSSTAGGSQAITCQTGVEGSGTATCPAAPAGNAQNAYTYMTTSTNAPTGNGGLTQIACIKDLKKCYGGAVDNSKATKGLESYSNVGGGIRPSSAPQGTQVVEQPCVLNLVLPNLYLLTLLRMHKFVPQTSAPFQKGLSATHPAANTILVVAHKQQPELRQR